MKCATGYGDSHEKRRRTVNGRRMKAEEYSSWLVGASESFFCHHSSAILLWMSVPRTQYSAVLVRKPWERRVQAKEGLLLAATRQIVVMERLSLAATRQVVVMERLLLAATRQVVVMERLLLANKSLLLANKTFFWETWQPRQNGVLH